MQSESDSQGNEHLPYCRLQRWVMHIESFEHGSAAGPGTAIAPVPEPIDVGCGAVLVAVPCGGANDDVGYAPGAGCEESSFLHARTTMGATSAMTPKSATVVRIESSV